MLKDEHFFINFLPKKLQRQLKVKNLNNDTPFLTATYLKITGTFGVFDRKVENVS